MSLDLADFSREIHHRVQCVAESTGMFAEDAFFDLFCGSLVASGDLQTADRAHYNSSRGIRIDGYGGDPLADSGTLSLIVAEFNQSGELATLTGSELDAAFKRTQAFALKSLSRSFREALEETSPASGLAEMIAERWGSTVKVRIHLITNKVLSARIDGREAGALQGLPVFFNVWDLGRLHAYEASGAEREPVEIDFTHDLGGSLPALRAHLGSAGYEAYLVVIPGQQLAGVYDRWGARLLEQNVRVFLQARGGVNKGVKATIENEPGMFFAYNNGITATAESVTLSEKNGHLSIEKVRNLQIVNGGQTTASIHAASKKKGSSLASVFVQMKLSIIPSDRTHEVVPKISEYANSQNKVNAADFFANHPFHMRMESFSRRILAPAVDGTFRDTKWFYERARGQYQDMRSRLSGASLKAFDLEYPKAQLITKTDLAKVHNVWIGHPDMVSKGSQRNFAHFAHLIGREWAKSNDDFNERFYRDCIAKTIIFRGTERIVSSAEWFENGYRANIVAYAIAKLAHDVGRLNRYVDLNAVWKAQRIGPALESALALAARAAYDNLVTTPQGVKNVTEWAKVQACWSRFLGQRIEWPQGFITSLLRADEVREALADARKDQKVLEDIEAQTLVVNAGNELWRSLREWGRARKALSSTEIDVLEVAGSVPRRIPSGKQSLVAIKALQRLSADGFRWGRDLGPLGSALV